MDYARLLRGIEDLSRQRKASGAVEKMLREDETTTTTTTFPKNEERVIGEISAPPAATDANVPFWRGQVISYSFSSVSRLILSDTVFHFRIKLILSNGTGAECVLVVGCDLRSPCRAVIRNPTSSCVMTYLAR